MKKTIVLFAVLAFAIAMLFPVRSILRAAAGNPHPAIAAPSPAAAAPAEPHPEIQAALEALRNARQHLAHGAHDFGGHRANALRLTDQAIQECREALRYDRH